MREKQNSKALLKSKFLRSMFLRLTAIILVVSIAIFVIVFVSFSAEIRNGIISDRQTTLKNIESTISQRMAELSSIGYNISEDSTFYISQLGDEGSTGREMAQALSRYLIGNEFIKYLAYYRLSEPNVIYTAVDEVSYDSFFNVSLKFDDIGKEEYLSAVTSTVNPNIILLSHAASDSYFTYVYTLPKFSQQPQAFVLMLVPLSEILPMLESQFINNSGEMRIYDAKGKMVYSRSTFDKKIDLNLSDYAESGSQKTIKSDNTKYIVQTQVSDTNSWTYLSIIRQKDTMSGLAQSQLIVIILLLSLMVVAILAIGGSVVIKFKPISKLAGSIDQGSDGSTIDEGAVLTNKLASLQDDSDQRQKFETAYHEAEAANKAKSAFLSSMSHDIRTPMNAIIGMTALASQNVQDTEFVGECLSKVKVASQYLLDIINNVLDMSRIESGRFTLATETISLPTIIGGLRTILMQSVEARSQNFVIEAHEIKDEKFIGDNVRLTQIFVNILSNSIKFTPNGGSIMLDISQTPSDKEGYGNYVFKFSDNGIGMTPEFKEHVFDTFSRAKDSDGSKVEGTGLGMAIVKSLVELMGGSIVCESEKGVGTTFTVSLCLQLADTEQTKRIETEFEQYRDKRVLIIGENRRLCTFEAQLFEFCNMKPVYVSSTDEAVNAFKQKTDDNDRYDVVLINRSEDDLNGIVAAKRIFEAANGQKPIVVFAAPSLNDVNFSAAKQVGISAFVQPPLFRSTVLRMLAASTDPSEAKDAAQDKVDFSGKKVLLVEDNQINREIANMILSKTNAEVFEATDGLEAVEAFSKHPENYFDVILMDLRMPKMNGYEATVAIRSMIRSDAQTVPIYAMTANTFDEDVRQVKEAGMNGHIAKPYTEEELYEKLTAIFAKQVN